MRMHLLRKRRAKVEGRPLYPEHLGAAWSKLLPVLQSAHVRSGAVHGVGTFRIDWGTGRLARMVARISRLPTPADAVRTHLFVYPIRSRERWVRRFGSHYVVTTQHRAPPRNAAGFPILAERFGLLELRFIVEPDGQGLRYRQVAAGLAWRNLRIPLPRFLAPIVNGWEHPAAIPDHTRVQVHVSVAAIGTLITYDGIIRIREVRT